jgi:hypothetical protein
MKRRERHVFLVVIVAALGAQLAAQGTGQFSGNPTPGTPQPDPPNLADRITLTGCVRWAAPNGRGSVPARELNTPSTSTFILTDAVREARVPAGTGTSDAAKKSASRTYRLSAVNSALVPFVGAKVEISGEVENSPAREDAPRAPVLTVGFVQRLAKTPCP